eukprot:Seg161.2 transcript_id=Seg161.2/GoldUCD/mRNA.D3Y31 product="hypothetical protein" protein_id=Seg161.2/GoldUCD/D3Y31
MYSSKDQQNLNSKATEQDADVYIDDNDSGVTSLDETKFDQEQYSPCYKEAIEVSNVRKINFELSTESHQEQCSNEKDFQSFNADQSQVNDENNLRLWFAVMREKAHKLDDHWDEIDNMIRTFEESDRTFVKELNETLEGLTNYNSKDV